MDITEIKQSLAPLICGYFECKVCGAVDNGRDTLKVGNQCTTCGGTEIRRMHFNTNIHILVDMIQETFHTLRVDENAKKQYQGVQANDVSVVLFFCTLRETLLNSLITRLIITHKLTDGITSQLLSDNKFHVQKQNKLFLSLTGTKWREALKKITKPESYNYTDLDAFIASVVRCRNSFVHEGRKCSIDARFSEECLRALPRLTRMYVALHNEFVHPLIFDYDS